MTSALPSVPSSGIRNFGSACRFGTTARTVHIYLALLHGVAEERVQQQVLQIGVAVERLFDFSQEDAEGQGWRKGRQASSFLLHGGGTESPLSQLL